MRQAQPQPIGILTHTATCTHTVAAHEHGWRIQVDMDLYGCPPAWPCGMNMNVDVSAAAV